MKKIFQRAIAILGIIFTCLLGSNLGLFNEQLLSPVALPSYSPMLASQLFKDPAPLVRANYTPEEATRFAWETFLALYAPDCSKAPVREKQVEKRVLYSVILLLMYDLLYKVKSRDRHCVPI